MPKSHTIEVTLRFEVSPEDYTSTHTAQSLVGIWLDGALTRDRKRGNRPYQIKRFYGIVSRVIEDTK